jgi:hypothetical protein
MPVSRQDSIDAFRRLVGDDPPFQHRVWAAQRAGWAAMGGLVLLALAGGLGDGPLTNAEAASPDDTLRVRHATVARQDSAMRWTITLPPARREVTITSAALDWLEVVAIRPRPASQARRRGAMTLRFDAPGEVVLTLEPRRPGLAAISVSSGDAATRFRTLVLP